MSRIDIIAFDADDTLWHNETLYSQAKTQFQQLLSPYGEPERIRRRLDALEEANIRFYGYGLKSFALSMVEAAIEVTEGRVAGSEMQQIIEITKRMLSAEVEQLENAEAALAALSGEYPLMLITKGDSFEQHGKIERSGLAKYFQYIEIVIDKTAHSYRTLLSKYNLEPEGMLMVGNSLRSDVLPVLEIGGQAVYIPYASTWAHEHVDEAALQGLNYHVLESLGLLPALIEQLSHSND